MPPAMPDRVDDLIREAMQNRPELKSLRLQQSAAERFTRAEHDLYYPSVGVIGTAGFVPAAVDTIPGRYGAIGMNVSIPIFNGGLFKARQTEAALKAKAATENVNDLQNRVIRDVRVAWLNATTAYDRMALTHATAAAGNYRPRPGADPLRLRPGQYRRTQHGSAQRHLRPDRGCERAVRIPDTEDPR